MTSQQFPLPTRFRNLRSLGAGAMGEVFLVRDRHRPGHGDLALKVCRTPDQTEALDRFRREFVTLAKLVSPALPEVRDFGVGEENTFWFTYAYVPGEDILAWSAQASTRDLYAVAGQLCDVLTYIHSRGLLHLDVKPANIIVKPSPGGPQAKLVDFGIVRSFPADHIDRILGTLPYTAPEMLRGEDPGPPADFFSLGVTLFECLFRTRPCTPQPSRRSSRWGRCS